MVTAGSGKTGPDFHSFQEDHAGAGKEYYNTIAITVNKKHAAAATKHPDCHQQSQQMVSMENSLL
ncbi:hypothetical protein GCM10022209_26570 [Chitinophaga oryziterrae]